MKKEIVFWLGLGFVLSLLLAACSGTTPTSQAEESRSAEIVVTEEPKSAESEVTEQPAAAGEETVPTDSAPRKSTLKIATDFTLPDGKGNMVSLADELQENEQVVLVFYYSNLCLPCMAQLREIEIDRARYEEKGTQVIAIAVQNEREAERSAWNSDAKFPILADSEHTVAEAYGVYELSPGDDKDDGLSTPTVFIINQDRQIIWSQISHYECNDCGKERVPGEERVSSQTILENLPVAEETVYSLNPVTTPDGDQVGESALERETDRIVLNFEACCVTPGNAYTAWWVIGDVTKPMSAVKTVLATGFVADDEGVNLQLELKAGSGGINNPLDGVRLAVLDHGLATGDPLQLSTPGGGCTSMPCPVALETSHEAP